MRPVGVLVFPGSNCEHDVVRALGELGAPAELVWHAETDLSGYDGLVLPGGFAHGDYLRPGALARFSPVMGAVADAAAQGRPVLGICNGFQILTEAGLLPGALRQNTGLTFISRPVALRVASSQSVLTRTTARGTRLVIPINHFSGAYTCDDATYAQLVEGGQVVLTYEDNPNGSRGDIAGIANAAGNVVGLMPHPERAMSSLLGSADGRGLLQSFVESTVLAA